MNHRLVIHNLEYDPCSGGIKVLHYLAYLLRLCGYPVATTCTAFFDSSIPLAGGCQPDDIAVYPEIIPDNFLGAARSARYLLFYPRHAFPKGDCPIVYQPAFLDAWRSACDLPLPADDLVPVPLIESAHWCFPEPKQIDNLLFIGKQSCPVRPDLPVVEIPPVSDPNRFRFRQTTLSLLRKSRNLYLMDHHTALALEGVLCGCRVFQVHGANDFREFNADPEPWVMRPMRDRPLGEKFVAIIRKFFNL